MKNDEKSNVENDYIRTLPDKKQKINLQAYILINVFLILFGIIIIINSNQLAYYIFPNLIYIDFLFAFIGAIVITFSASSLLINFLNKNTRNLSSIDDKNEFKKLIKNIELTKIPFKNINKTNSYKESSNSFKEYFNHIIKNLELKSSDADKKASILLDNGKFYSMIGIFYFIISIIVWQFYISSVGFKTHHIYGIISSSLVFVFIEFLSAWYLRQYKSFSDTSTYLTKIKSIFDKYMLIYLISVEINENDFNVLLEQLASEIKWPETYLLKNADISFAKEALETMTTMAQAFQKEVQK